MSCQFNRVIIAGNLGSDPFYKQRDDGLKQAQECLVDRMRRDVGADMNAASVLALYDGAFAADILDRVEKTVPYADTCNGEGAEQRALHGGKQTVLHD